MPVAGQPKRVVLEIAAYNLKGTARISTSRGTLTVKFTVRRKGNISEMTVVSENGHS